MNKPKNPPLPSASGQMSFDWSGSAATAGAARLELTTAQLNGWLDDWVAAGWLRSVDRAVAHLIQQQVPETSPWALLAVVFASHLAGQGYVCLDLAACWQDADLVLVMPPNNTHSVSRRLAGESQRHGVTDEAAEPIRPAQILAGTQWHDWLAVLGTSLNVIGTTAGDQPAAAESTSQPPLILDGARLYLRRHWLQEQAVAQAIGQRLQSTRDLPDAPRIHAILTALFPRAVGGSGRDWQKIACAVALRSAFALITGGPGTGKTTTVVKFLMLTQMLALQAGKPPLRILLCAPTGKAAARLRQSLLSQMDALCAPFAAAYPQLRATLPDTVDTVHHLIGIRPDQAQPKFHAGAPLPADVVVIDEASMLGLALMAKTLAALSDHTQLIMLGDKDQLASVEPGAVLGELSTAALSHGGYTPALVEWINATTGEAVDASAPTGAGQTALAAATVWLRHSHRFGAASAIAKLADCVNAGDAQGAVALLAAEKAEPATLALLRDTTDRRPLFATVLAVLSPWLSLAKRPWDAADLGFSSQDDWARAIFAAQQQAQILCALRHGAYGVVGLNAGIEQSLVQAGLIAPARHWDGWYAGRPVMITRNDRALNLANGDVGIALPYRDPAALQLVAPAAELRVAFLSDAASGAGEPAVRWLHPQRLDAVETAFALTVHKAQGSEFDHSILVLPAAPNPVVTRALIYTAITRARSKFTLIAAASDSSLRVLRQGILRQAEPSGQLGDLLVRDPAELFGAERVKRV
jgi:exodeoxyribonuclease V alpha subunit